MQMSKLIPIVFIIILLLQACLPTMQIEKSGIINTRGIDLLEESENSMIETTVIPYLFDPNAQDITSILVGKGHTIKEARDEASKQSSYVLTPGQIRLELYGKEAAEKGILPYLNTLIRDARVSETMQLAVTNQTAKEVLMSEQSSITINTAQYLQDLILKEIKRDSLPSSSLHDFTREVEHVGLDPVLPLIDVVENRPTLVGAAVFHRDEYVQQITLSEAFLINLLRKRVKDTPLDAYVPLDNYKDKIAYKEDEGHETFGDEEYIYVFLSLLKGKGKLKLVDEENLHYKADIEMKVELLETSIPMDIKTEETSKRLEKDLNKHYEKQYEQLFSKLQEAKSDAFGLGRVYSGTRKGSKTTIEQWQEKYPNATIEFNIDITIRNYGTID